jgi:hypothetical protein
MTARTSPDELDRGISRNSHMRWTLLTCERAGRIPGVSVSLNFLIIVEKLLPQHFALTNTDELRFDIPFGKEASKRDDVTMVFKILVITAA